jgi:MFS family permease
VWAAHTVSNVGDGVTIAAGPLLAASLSDDPRVVGSLAFALLVPWLALPPLAGVLADRLDRRRVLVAADLLRAAVMATLAVVVLDDRVSIPLLVAAFLLLGAGEVVFDTTAEALVPDLVRDDQLEAANGRLQSAETVGNEFAGPLLGGALFAVAEGLPFGVDAASFAASAVLVGRLGGRFRSAADDAAPASIGAEVLTAARWLWRNQLVRRLAVVAALANLVQGATFWSTFVLYAREELGVGPAGFGALLAAGGVGGALGAAAVAALPPSVRTSTVVALAPTMQVAGFAVLAATSSPWVAGAMTFLNAVSAAGWNVVALSLRQAAVPRSLRGRVSGLVGWLGSGALALGALVGGFVGAALGLRDVFVCGAAGWAVATAIALRTLAARPADPGHG